VAPNPNIAGKWKVTVQKAQAERGQVYVPLLGQWTGLLGRNDGVVQNPAYATGYVFVRGHDGSLMTMWNQNVPNIADLWVVYGYTVAEPKLLQVISQWTSFNQQPAPNLPNHHATHEWPGYDTVFVHGEQVLPWLVRPTAGVNFSIDIFPGLERVGGSWIFSSPITIDLTSHIPTAGARFVVICMDDTGAFSVVDGAAVDTPEILTGGDVPIETAGTTVKAIVRLYAGQASIRQDAQWEDIFDPRFATGLSSGGFPSETPYRFLIVNASGVVVTDSYFKMRGDGSKSAVFGGWDPSQGGDGLVHVVGDGVNVAGRIIAWYLGTVNQPGHTGIRGRGTPAAPAFVHAGDILEVIRGAGFGVTDQPSPGDVGYALPADAASSALWSKFEIRVIAKADWSTTASWPTKLEFWAVPIGSTVKQLIATFDDTGINLPTGENFMVNGVPIGGGGGGFPISRVLAADLTVPDTDYFMVGGYLDASTFNIDLQGDALLDIQGDENFGQDLVAEAILPTISDTDIVPIVRGGVLFRTLWSKITSTLSALYMAIVAPGTSGNVLTSDGSNWISQAPISAPISVGARVFLSVAPSSNPDVTISFDTKEYDTDGIFNLSHPTRLTCNTAGIYLIIGSVGWAPNVTGIRSIQIQLNAGLTVIARLDFQAVSAAGFSTTASISTSYKLAVGDYVQLYAYQGSGGALLLNSILDYTPVFSMQRIG
jgi:hypothetical protein